MRKFVLFFVWANLSFISSLFASEAKPFVTCSVVGQLGNQMCQVATTLAHAWDNNAQAFFPFFNETFWKIAYNRDHFFFRLNFDPPPGSIENLYCEKNLWDYEPIPFVKNQQLSGIFFHWKYFHHHREKLLEIFAPSESIRSYLLQKYSYFLAHPKTVSVHVRTFNEQYHSICPFLGLEYYRQALDCFPNDTLFVVFSDRINWCKHHFQQFNKKMVFVEEDDHIAAFFLMLTLKGHILANSSYSWWAAYLDNKPEKIVVAPRYWYRIDNEFFHPIEEKNNYLFFPEWILIENNPNGIYPKDMLAYDKCSQSVD